MSSFNRFVAQVNRLFLLASGALILVILVAMTWDLVARNVFNAPTLWALDTCRFALVFLFFLAIAPALESGAHVSVDVVYEYLPQRSKSTLQLVAYALVIVFAGFLLWLVFRESREAFTDDGFFPTVIPVKMKYIYWIGPVGVLQFLLTAVSLVFKTVNETQPGG